MEKISLMAHIACLGVLCVYVAAAAPDGKWVVTLPDLTGKPHDITFDLHADRGALTGTMSSIHGSLPISEGKVQGNEISFVVVFPLNGRELRLIHHGVISGDAIEFTRHPEGGGKGVTFTAKKIVATAR